MDWICSTLHLKKSRQRGGRSRSGMQDTIADGVSPAGSAKVAFPAGNDDFRAVRNHCSRACRKFNEIPEDAPAESRVAAWLDIVDPARVRFPVVAAADSATSEIAFKDPTIKPVAPFVKPPIYMDYGLRVNIAPTAFINRGCTILDTPTADIRIGRDCNIGPNVSIYGVTHAEAVDEATGKRPSLGRGVVIGDRAWIGGGAIILGGVTIGDDAIVGAGSVVIRDVPARAVAMGNPAEVIRNIDPTRDNQNVCARVLNLEEALLTDCAGPGEAGVHGNIDRAVVEAIARFFRTTHQGSTSSSSGSSAASAEPHPHQQPQAPPSPQTTLHEGP